MEHLGGDYSKILLGGFSQGCAMAFNTMFTMEQCVAGVIALSGHIISPDQVTEATEDKKTVPMLIYHGK